MTDDSVRRFLLDTVADGKSHDPQVLAHAYHAARAKPNDPPDAWRRYLNAIRQQALSLARSGQIEFTRKGKAVDPNAVKGVFRLRRPAAGAS